jgi:hypothetical protein
LHCIDTKPMLDGQPLVEPIVQDFDF